jgi:hypothetical protein
VFTYHWREGFPRYRLSPNAWSCCNVAFGRSRGTPPRLGCGRLRLSRREPAALQCCVRGPIPPIKIERTYLLIRTGQQGNVYQAHQLGKWNPRSSAYGRFWIDVPSGERKRRTISLGLCATQWVARLRLREYIERAGVCSKDRFHPIPVPGTTFRQQAEWWMESLSKHRRRPLKPSTIYGWQHCLDRWILPNLANKLLSEVGNGALRQFVQILSAAGLAPKTIVNVVTVVHIVLPLFVHSATSSAEKRPCPWEPGITRNGPFSSPLSSRCNLTARIRLRTPAGGCT